LCFVPLDADAPKFFGFSEFLAGLALMILAWTIADTRYRFRVMTAPLPLQIITFYIISALGVLTLMTDLWRAEQWLVPQGNILTPAIWQALLGGLFLLTFLTWACFAFIRPPVYGKRNAKRYAQTLYQYILKGATAELGVIADELTRSAASLVHCARERTPFKSGGSTTEGGEHQGESDILADYADSILFLIADKRFCRAIVASSPDTALAIFKEIGTSKKYYIPVETFAQNILNEALMNRDSFLYHEADGYQSGLMGYHKPLSQAMFSNHQMVEAIDILDPDLQLKEKWDSTQWKAYCRAVLMTFSDYVEKGCRGNSIALHRAMGYITGAVSDLYKINGLPNINLDDDTLSKPRVVVKFIRDAVAILDEKGSLSGINRHPPKRLGYPRDIYDDLANMIFEVISSASSVQSPASLCWRVQHNYIWGELFNFMNLDGPAGKIVKSKACRYIYDEVTRMNELPNFRGTQILGFCLNVMGLVISNRGDNCDSRALQRAVLSWTRKHYVWLYSQNPRVAEACLVDSITYDAEHFRLVKTYPPTALSREPRYVYFDLN
jgi:hypothetical protein